MGGSRSALLAVAACVLVLVGACSGDDTGPDPSRGTPQAGASVDESPSETAEESPSPTLASPAPAELPAPLSLKDVDGRTIRAEPFADFAVADGEGVWVTGVTPGAVRYHHVSGDVTGRLPLNGSVEQVIESSAGSVWIPTTSPELLRVDAVTGRVQERVPLPGRPLTEGVVGVTGETAYVIGGDVDRPTIYVVKGGRVADEIPAPEAAVAVRAGYGALWVPTAFDTVERYDLESGEWTSIPSGPGPRFLDVGYGAVWVMDQQDGTVTRIDAKTLEPEVLSGSQYFIHGGDLAAGEGGVWLRTQDSVLRLDPRSGEVTHLLELPPGSGAVVATPRALWITNHDHLAVHVVPLPLAG